MKIFKKYNWIFEFIAAALLLATGFVVIFVDEIILYITGSLFILMGLLRVIPLIKSTSDKLMRWLLLGEIIIGIGAGGLLIYMGTEGATVEKNFGYIVGGIFYLRGFTHFVATSLRGEPNNTLNFFVHIILLTLGVFLIVYGEINQRFMSIVIGIIIFICVLFLCVKGGMDYSNYRGELVSEHQTKKMKENIKVDKSDIAPSKEELNVDITNIDNDNDYVKIDRTDA